MRAPLWLKFCVLPLCLHAVIGCRHRVAVTPPLPNLAWDGPKTYSTGSLGIPLKGFGVNATVDQLPPGPFPMLVTITRDLSNSGSAPAPGGYEVTEKVEALSLISGGTSVGFAPKTGGATVADLAMLGAPLAPGKTMPISFTFGIPGCGMYKETLTADSTGIVKETTKVDNTAVHYFAVPGTMALNVAVNQVVANTNIWHAAGGPMPSFVMPQPVLPATVYSFTITATTPGTTFFYNYDTKPIVGISGSVAIMSGPAPVQPPMPPVAGPVTINFQLSSVVTHSDQPMTDILTETVQEQFFTMLTAITADGCFVRQNSAGFSVWHPGR